MANYSTQFSFSFSVGNKAGELIQQALTYFGEDEEDRDADVFSPEWESVFAAHNNEPENWANEVSGETATGATTAEFVLFTPCCGLSKQFNNNVVFITA